MSVTVTAGAGAEVGTARDALEPGSAHLTGQAGVSGRTPGK